MKFDFEIPQQLAHLKVDERGYPIPYFARVIDGKPNFRLIDSHRFDQCLDRKLCGICGKKLFKDGSYLISGAEKLKSRVSAEPMMHQVCARFALRVCPHLYFEKTEGSDGTPKLPEIYLVKVSNWKISRGQIISTGRVSGVQDRTRLRLIHYTPVSSEKYVYQNNVLVLDRSGDDQDLK